MKDLKPAHIVAELDTYIIGQGRAKRSVAIALRNRWRRRHVPDDLKDEIAPKNIILIGPTGVGKTEIARRLAKLTDSPFYKVEASKFTEVGYVGRDVESMIRDLTELTVNQIKSREQETVREKAHQAAEERILDILLPPSAPAPVPEDGISLAEPGKEDVNPSTREKLRQMLRDGRLDERFIDLEVSERAMPIVEIFSNAGMEEMGVNLKDMFGNLFPKNTRKRKIRIVEAFDMLTSEEAQRMVDMDKVVDEAVNQVEQNGIVFLDEIDKIIGKSGGSGPDVSREGVQRDLLPIVEGSTVTTKYGPVKTDHILFIASGAFHASKPSDLIPELQGRFPIRVELDSLGKQEFVRILTEPKNALLLQYKELLKTEGVEVRFTDEAICEIAAVAEEVNASTDNIGARRLHTLMECLLEQVLFDAPDIQEKQIDIDDAYVRAKFKDIRSNEDLSRYIL